MGLPSVTSCVPVCQAGKEFLRVCNCLLHSSDREKQVVMPLGMPSPSLPQFRGMGVHSSGGRDSFRRPDFVFGAREKMFGQLTRNSAPEEPVLPEKTGM